MGSILDGIRSITDWMAERGVSFDDLLAGAGLDRKVLDAIVHGRYTPSPEQRQRLAAVLSVESSQIAWGHTHNVEHIYGHGPQFGRSP